jgi:hypothetical protein
MRGMGNPPRSDVFVERDHRIGTEIHPSEVRSKLPRRSLRAWTAVVVAMLTIVVTACSVDGSTTTTGSSAGTTTTSTPEPEAQLVVSEGVMLVNDSQVSIGVEPIEFNDQISLEDGARGFLTIGDYAFELFMGTTLTLVDLNDEDLKADLDRGHLRFNFSDDTDARLTLETPSAVLTTLGADAKFTVCAPADKTCLAVETGAVELKSAGKALTYEKGEGTATQAAFVSIDTPPGAAICIPDRVFDDWFEAARLNQISTPLGALVNQHRECDADVQTASITVLGVEGWTDTRLDVESGDTVEVAAGGSIRHADGGVLVDPDGDLDDSLHVFNIAGLEDTNHAALIGRIGDDGTPFLVGRTFEGTFEADGRLFLGINDAGLTNNSGEFFALVKVISG